MAISKKNKRLAIVNGKEYLWWAFDECDQTEFDGVQVQVISADKTHFIKYGLQQPEGKRKVVLALTGYAKLVHLSAPPKFENEDGVISNSGICRMIEWCKTEDLQIQYALIASNNQLTPDEKKLLLKELQSMLD